MLAKMKNQKEKWKNVQHACKNNIKHRETGQTIVLNVV